MESRSNLTTEKQNLSSKLIDLKSPEEILHIINSEDETVAHAVKKAIPQISKTISFCIFAIKNGNRIIYVGAGTSGRLGVLDASEIPPTFSAPSEWFTGVIAGGEKALRKSVEGAEDIPENGIQDLQIAGITEGDVVIGVSTSGAANYVKAALKYAQEIGAKTCYITCNPEPFYRVPADSIIKIETGSEIITGSTRMKAGTATKMVLNMISTTTMIKLGKVYGNLMVDLMAVNEKLMDRGTRIITQLTNTDYEYAHQKLIESDKSVKRAIIMIKKNCSSDQAELKLKKAEGFLGKVLKES
ncbi:MAG: N-acetylmuramic acid 6-phosphate etherase [Candidatus Marinimicrobia bacterium]|jgi:N-acetylmuramic acid 6-phosphate etherase|nr:N-acetylmuramic acid 6-phosphate etherase [Candidatus Neomarinimicrobiota bacterium]